MSDTEDQATNHKQPASKATKAATDDAAKDATKDATTDGAAADARSAIDGLSQAAGDAAQRAGVAAQRATEVLTDVAGDVASTVSAHAPAVLDASRKTTGIAAREVQSASSENLMLGTVFSSGIAFGLMLARAPRVLVLLALTPVVVFGANLVGRRNSRGSAVTPRPSGSKPAAKPTDSTRGKSSVS